MPSTIHMTRRIQVSAGRKSIMPTQHMMPAIGTHGTSGVRNPRGASGMERRTTRMPVQTSVKAKIITKSPTVYVPGTPGEGEERAYAHHFACHVCGHQSCQYGYDDHKEDIGTGGRVIAGVEVGEEGRKQAVATHGIEDAALPHQHDEDDTGISQ